MYMVCIGDMGFYMDLTGVVAADMGVGLGLRARKLPVQPPEAVVAPPPLRSESPNLPSPKDPEP